MINGVVGGVLPGLVLERHELCLDVWQTACLYWIASLLHCYRAPAERWRTVDSSLLLRSKAVTLNLLGLLYRICSYNSCTLKRKGQATSVSTNCPGTPICLGKWQRKL